MANFASTIIIWQKQFGRHHLPWQNTTDPYAIWVSEIMLQQTQVAAVVGYYRQFMQRFPDIKTLAAATQDEVLQFWSGLGYYSRARHLHQAAQIINDDFAGIFPQSLTDILRLPGIGRSTAAAISTFAFNHAAPILDGNVKRVFARHFLIEGWPGSPKVQQTMWQRAEAENPTIDAIAYTQGLMDLGATLCTRTKPKCQLCPVQTSCGAFSKQLTHVLPSPKPFKKLPEYTTTMLVLFDGVELMLEKRPNQGIWGGLWSFPEADNPDAARNLASQYHLDFGANYYPLDSIKHAFTHYKLTINPIVFLVGKPSTRMPNTIWLPIDEARTAAIPTPIRRIIDLLSLDDVDKKTAA